MITELSIHNYKSLRNVRLVGLPALAVLVGANGSGKSNFVDALDFLSLIFQGGLAHALRTKGGYENVCWRRARRSKGAIEFSMRATTSGRGAGRQEEWEFKYAFGFQAKTEAIFSEYVVTHEHLLAYRTTLPSDVLEIKREGGGIETNASADILRRAGLVDLKFFERYVTERLELLGDDELVVPMLPALLRWGLGDLMAACRVYQISPHMARETGVPERSPELGRHGENLPAAVEYLKRQQPDAFNELLAHLRHTLPTIRRIDTEYVETKQLGLFFTEEGVGRRWFSHDVSDGTIQSVAIFLPLLDRRVKIALIEEPENSVHPWILRHFIDACKITSASKQVFITTHSLVAVNEVPPASLYITSRKSGETKIVRAIAAFPETAAAVANAILGLGDYWDSGALLGVPTREPK